MCRCCSGATENIDRLAYIFLFLQKDSFGKSKWSWSWCDCETVLNLFTLVCANGHSAIYILIPCVDDHMYGARIACMVFVFFSKKKKKNVLRDRVYPN